MLQSVRNKLLGLREIWTFDNRWHLLLARLLFKNEPIHIYRTGGLDILIDHSAGDANAARNIIATPMYTEHFHRLERNRPLRVLDIGANNGGFPLLLQLNKFQLAKVVCVELNPRTCIRLRFNVDRNIAAQHQVINAALCGHARTVETRLGSGSVADSIYEPSHNADRSVRVTGMTFDDIYVSAFGDERVDICKIDVEYAEYEVFAAPGHALLSRCRYLFIEIHEGPDRRPQTVVDAIVSCGFRELPHGTDPSVHCFANVNA